MSIEAQEDLYNLITENELYNKSFDEFKTQFANPESQSRLYNGMVSEGLYPQDKSKSEFVNQFFVAEKKNPIETEEPIPLEVQSLTPIEEPATKPRTVLPPASEKPKSSSGTGMMQMATPSESKSPLPKPGQSQGKLLIPEKKEPIPSLKKYDVSSPCLLYTSDAADE